MLDFCYNSTKLQHFPSILSIYIKTSKKELWYNHTQKDICILTLKKYCTFRQNKTYYYAFFICFKLSSNRIWIDKL